MENCKNLMRKILTPILYFQMASLCIAMSMIGIFRSELNIFMVLVLMHALAETALICGRNLSDYHGNDETGEKEAGERRRRTVKVGMMMFILTKGKRLSEKKGRGRRGDRGRRGG